MLNWVSDIAGYYSTRMEDIKSTLQSAKWINWLCQTRLHISGNMTSLPVQGNTFPHLLSNTFSIYLCISALCLWLYRTCVQPSDSNATSLFIIYEPRLCDRHFIIFGIRFKRLENVNVRFAKLSQLWFNRPDLKHVYQSWQHFRIIKFNLGLRFKVGNFPRSFLLDFICILESPPRRWQHSANTMHTICRCHFSMPEVGKLSRQGRCASCEQLNQTDAMSMSCGYKLPAPQHPSR